jgi:NAD(P)-dependent dehydrogenase (short-subunit alcohol dehydrogenase family)
MSAPSTGLTGRGVLCTGAAGRIGTAVCRTLAESGARVFLADLPGSGVAKRAAELPGEGHTGLESDLRDVSSVTALVDAAESELGRVDVLVHLAAVLRRQPLGEVGEADWDLQIDVNLKATFFLARACAERMAATGVDGRIVLYASQAWLTGGHGGSHVYAMSKAGVVTLTRGLAREYGPRGIRVNAVAPGCVDTPMLRDGLPDETLDAIVAATPLRRLGTPDELAAVAVFLASDSSSFVTGTVLNASGGWLTY